MALSIYRWLLCLYPASYRDEFSNEMARVFRDARSALPKTFYAKLGFYWREFPGLVSGAVSAHLDRLFGPAIPFPRFYMQPQFRFPRSTVFLMFVILAGVLMAIEQAKVIVNKLSYASLPHEVISIWNGLPWFLFWAVACPCVAVAAIWGVLFALRRTGMHRLDGMRNWAEHE
jgi:hypothetical protein